MGLSNLDFYRDKNLLQEPVRRFEYAGQTQDRQDKGKATGTVLPNGKVMNKYIVSVDSPDFFKSPFEANRPYFESHGLKKMGGVQKFGNPEPQFMNGEPVGPARYDTRLDCRAPDQFQDTGGVTTGYLTPREGTGALTPRENTGTLTPRRNTGASTPRGNTTPTKHEHREEKHASKKREKYEGKINELQRMQKQLAKQERQLNSKLSKTYRSSSVSGVAESRNHRKHGSGSGSRGGTSHAKTGSSGGQLAPRARSTRR